MNKFLFILLFLPFALKAQIVSTVAGNGVGGFGGDNAPASAAQLQHPNAIAFDRNGNMYISDGGNYRIRKVDINGIITTVAGNGTSLSGGDNGSATNAGIVPVSITVDSPGNIYVSEQRRIRKISPAGIITTIAGTGVLGYNGDSIAATAADIYDPYLGFADATGALYFSDCSNHRIRKIDAAGIITTIAGVGVSGSAGDGGPATACNLNTPLFLSQDIYGALYFHDRGARRSRKIDTSGIVTAFAVTGAGGIGGNGGPATAAAVGQASNIVVDGTGNAYISTGSGNNIRVVDTAGLIDVFAGNGTAGFSGDGGSALSASFDNIAFAVLYNGSLYVADVYNNRIRCIQLPQLAITTKVSPAASLYPNPAGHVLVIAAREPVSRLEVIGMDGICRVLNSALNPVLNKSAIDVSNLPPGTYIIIVNGQKAGTFVKARS